MPDSFDHISEIERFGDKFIGPCIQCRLLQTAACRHDEYGNVLKVFVSLDEPSKISAVFTGQPHIH